MKNFYTLLFFVALLCPVYTASAASFEMFRELKAKDGLTGSISGSASVCINATAPIITFSGGGGTAPYTFTYTINGGTPQTITTLTGNSVTLNASTNVVGSFTYALLKVTDSTGAEQNVTDSAIITIVPNFSVNAGTDIIVCKGNQFSLSATLSAGAPQNVDFQWTGPNGYSSSNQSTTISSATALMSGIYTIKAFKGNCERTDQVQVTVLDPELASSQLEDYDGTKWLVQCTAPGVASDIIFISNGIPQSLQSLVTGYTVNWGDSSTPYTSNNAVWNTNHEYNVGLYNLTVTISTTLGCNISRVYKVFVGNQPASPQIQLPENAQGCVPFQLTFPISGVSNNVPGTTYTITFSDDPSNPLNFDQNNIPLTVTRTFNTSSCGSTFTNGSNVENNAFGVSIRAVNPCGSASSSAGPIRTSTPPTAIISGPLKGCLNQALTISDVSLNGSIVTATNCNLNSGRYWEISPSSGWTTASNLGSNNGFPTNHAGWTNGAESLGVQFTTAGTYTIILYKKNSCTGTSTTTHTICIEPQLQPTFTKSIAEGCTPLAVSTNNSTNLSNQCGTPTYSWSVTFADTHCAGTSSPTWNYTNSTTAASANPSFNFVTPGTYTLRVSMTNGCGTAQSATQTVVVKKPPLATIAAIPNVCGSSSTTITPTVNFTNCGTQTPTYAWSSTGGATISNPAAASPTITYTAAGTYTVSVAVTNECGTTTDSETFTINPSPVLAAIANQEKCAGQSIDAIILNSSLPGTTYSWTNNTPSIGLAGSGTGPIPVFTAANTTNSPITATITVTPTVNGCVGSAQTFTIKVNPLATVNAINNITLCHNATQAAIAPVSNVSAATFTWTNTQPSIGLAGSGTGPLPSFIATNTGTAPVTATITITPTVNGCPGTPRPFTITVNPTPQALTLANKELCHNMASGAITFTNAVSGTIYSWTNSDPSIGLPSNGTGNIASFTAINTTTAVKTATITVTPTANGCAGAAQTFTITVSPSPVVTFSQPAQNICSGGSTTAVTLTSATPGAVFAWTATVPPGITGPTASGTNSIPPQTLLNSTNLPLEVIYKATASINGGVSCPGAEYLYTVTVNPRPKIVGQLIAEICSGTAFSTVPANGTGGNIIPANTTYTWSAPVINPAGAITGGTAESTPKTAISQTLTNITTATATATYTVTPVSGSCAGTPFDIVVTVKPMPVANAVAPIEFCAQDAVSAITFGGNITGITYNWTNSNTAIGLGANGTGDIPSFTAQNNTSSPITATISVTPVLNGCSGAATTFTITVNPAPSVQFSQTNQVICSGAASSAVTLSSTTSGASLSWEATIPSGIEGMTATSGTTSIPAQTLVNTTSSPIIITYTAKAETSGTVCPGPVALYTVTVNPVPSVTTPQTATICSGHAFTVTLTDGGGNRVPANTLYTWTAPTGNNISGGSAQATGVASISQMLTNTTNVPVTATYTVTPRLGNCNGTPFTVTVTINPTPVVSNTTKAICTGETFTIDPATIAGNNIPAGTTYTWAAPSIPAGITGGASGTDATNITGTLTNSTNAPINVVYTITPTSTVHGCDGADFTATVTVNPTPVINAMASQPICSNTAFIVTPLNSTDGVVPANTTYTWSTPDISPAGAITGGSAQAAPQPHISQNLVNTTNAQATATYTVTSKSGNCTGQPFVVTVPVNPVPTVDTVNPQTLCNGENTAAIQFTGAVTGTAYNWVNNTPSIGLPGNGVGDIASFQAINTGTSAVTATITVTPVVGGCSGTSKTFTITVNPAPSVMFSQANQSVCSGTSSAAVTLTSATPNTTFSWTATAPAGVTGVATSGTNSIPVQNLVNTTAAPITIEYIATAQTTGVACPGAPQTYTITVTPVPFVSTIQQQEVCSGTAFNITPADGAPNNVPTGTTFTWAAPTGTGFTGGSAQATPQNSISQILVNTTTSPVTATYNVTPWFNSCAGVPFILTITVNPTAVIADVTRTICSEGTFTVDPSTIPAASIPAGTTYSWGAPVVTGGLSGGTAGTGQNIITGSLINPTATTQTATYTITPLSPIGNCAGEPFDVVVTVRPQLQVVPVLSNFNGFEISTAGGNDGSVDLTPTGGSGSYTYSWTGPGGFSSALQDVNNLIAGEYIVTISDGLCNPVVLTIQIREPLPLVIQEVLSSHVDVDCFGQATGIVEVAITQASIAPFDYIISMQGGAAVETVMNSNAMNYVFDNLPAGTYDIQVIDANGTIKTIAGIIITQPASGLAIAGAAVSSHNGFNITCNGANNGSIELTVTGGYPAYTYSWTGPNGFTAVTQDISNLAPGAYTVVIGDSTNICTITATYTITEPQPLTYTGIISDYNGYGISCSGGGNGTITIAPTGGTGTYIYHWSGPNGFTATAQNLTGLYAGTYSLTVTDSNGCTNSTGVYTLTEPASMDVTETHTNLLCFGASTGSITVNVTGGVPGASGYTFSWTGPNGFSATTQNLSNIPAGTYTLTVTDASGCTRIIAITLIQPSEIIIVPTTTPISCYGANDATLTLAITGGVGPYQAEWDNFASGTYQENLAAGTYGITVTDGNNCTKTINVVIPEAPIFTINPVHQNISCHGANDGSIVLNFVGGQAPITLIWSDGSTSGTSRHNLPPGIYTVTITDSKPCVITRTFVITEPQPLVLSGSVTHANDCNNTMSGAVNLLVSGGMPPFTYAWSNGATTEDLSGITSGNYSVTVTDANGCTNFKQFTVTRPQPLQVSVANDISFNCDTDFVRQVNTATASGGVLPYQYTWSAGTVSGANGQIMSTNNNGMVTVTVTDGMGCTAAHTFEIDTQQLGDASYGVASYAYSTYGLYSIVDPIQFTNTSSGDYISVAWDFGDGVVSTENDPVHVYQREGNYTVTQTVTYPYGCVERNTFLLAIDKGYDIMIPTGFTPNGDGTNDLYNAQHRGLKKLEMSIYDTWGSLIYSEQGETLRGWDGTLNGRPAENGNYVYKFTATTFYGHTLDFTAPFTLLK